MKNETNSSSVLIKSHPKSVIKAVLIGSKEFTNIFNNVPIGNIKDSTCHIVVLQTMICANYVLVEYVREDEYTYSNMEAKNNG